MKRAALACLFFATTPSYGFEVYTPAFRRWIKCLTWRSNRLALESREPADTVVRAAFGACAYQEIEASQDPQAQGETAGRARRIVEETRALLSDRMITTILDLRKGQLRDGLAPNAPPNRNGAGGFTRRPARRDERKGEVMDGGAGQKLWYVVLDEMLPDGTWAITDRFWCYGDESGP